MVVLLTFLVFWSAIALLSPRDETAVKPPPAPPGGAARGDDRPEIQAEKGVVVGELPRNEVIRAQVGDIVELSVTSDRPDSVEIEALSLTDAVDRGAPARFSFLATEPASALVRYTVAGKVAGRLVITMKEGTARAARPERRARGSDDRSPRTTGR